MELFLYLGPEEFRKRETMMGTLRKHKFALEELQNYHGASVNLDEVQNLLLSPPLFGNIPPVLLTDIDLLSPKSQKQLADLCLLCRKTKNVSTLFFLFSKEYKISAALGKVFSKSEQKIFWELKEEEKKSHIEAFCRSHGKKIESSAIEVLLERVSGDVVTLERTLVTVFLYLGENATEISEELLNGIFTQSRDAGPYDLFHHMALRDLGSALRTVDSLLLQGSAKAVALIMQMLYQWDKLLQIKERMRFDSFEDVCSAEFVRTRALKADMRRGAENYSLAELRKVQKLTQDYNLDIKLGRGLQDLLFKHYVYEVINVEV
ncbi:MAG: DNA polymerase III subunit delta [Spirochaetota bacterium]